MFGYFHFAFRVKFDCVIIYAFYFISNDLNNDYHGIVTGNIRLQSLIREIKKLSRP